RRGRRPVATLFTLGVLLAILSFYSLAGTLSPLLWIPVVFGVMGTQVTLAAYGAEMFSTGVRSTASGIREVCKTGGGVTGLALVTLLYGVAGSSWMAVTLLCALGAFAPVFVLTLFPEHAGPSVEELGPEL